MVSHCSQAVIELVTVLLPQPPECCEVTEASASPGSVSLLWSAVAGPREPQALGPGWADLPFLFLLRSLPPRPSLCGQARRPQQLPAFALLRSVLKRVREAWSLYILGALSKNKTQDLVFK